MKHFLSMLFLSSVCALTWAQQTFGYKNPILPGFYPDPSAVAVGDDYYLVNSSFCYFPGVPLFHSKDMIHWDQIGHVLNRESQLPLGHATISNGIYAPTIRYHEGTFYMITTNVGLPGGDRNFLVYTDDIKGPWSDPVWIDMPGIDPSLFWDDDGRCYYVGAEDGVGVAFAEINPKTGEILTPYRTIWAGSGGRYPEAPHIIKKDGFYYLLMAEGGTEYGHKVQIARSKKIDGPYINNPAGPILTHSDMHTQWNPIQGTGHADLVQAADGSWWMVCLAFRPQTWTHHLTGRETYLAPVTWEKNAWPVVNGNGSIDLDMQVPTLPQTAATSKASRTLFNDSKLGYEWSYIRNPHMENYVPTPEGLHLHAAPEGTDATKGSPTWVGRRLQDIDFYTETQVCLTHAQASDEAGICIYMGPDSHYDLYLLQKEHGKQSVVLRYRLGLLSYVAKEMELSTSSTRVRLRINGDSERYTFSYSTDENHSFVTLGQMNTRYLSTETVGGFTGAFIGLYAKSNNIKSKAVGTFTYFEYEGK